MKQSDYILYRYKKTNTKIYVLVHGDIRTPFRLSLRDLFYFDEPFFLNQSSGGIKFNEWELIKKFNELPTLKQFKSLYPEEFL